ncbi:protein Z, vitamin K-dependent plasma glycoprotein a [Chanos chanos]|uniref:Coagulation factor X-like n=1 Tax=Chanos chanos TaxID=29144 RepID=A0A6J2WJJ6_CHACN|nr:coagulation factor X-like [Chanos chanos]XP_030645709.1 coagulation factor X-like [Chanos chanos]XP_030645710.1 coagulation factor X-like [Chanos chanos]
MVYWRSAFTVAVLCGFVAAGPDSRRAPVFLDKEDASAVISRQKRANEGNEESLPANLERECVEEVCNYEEAREVFQDAYRTDIFWSVYVDGDQCAGQPCKNGAMCSDSVGGYDCICKSGYSGVHCETDQTVCVVDKTKGCSQFCKPGYQSYECSCARGWKLSGKEKCVPAVSQPCGQVSSSIQWESRQSSNIRNDYDGLNCMTGECPWQALLKSPASGSFCNGVILKENLILTTAYCASKHNDIQVVVGTRRVTYEVGEQTLSVKKVHVHPLFVADSPENDLALVELQTSINIKNSVRAACLPERDFADSVLLTGEWMGMVTGWKDVPDATELQGDLRLNHLSYKSFSDCKQQHPGLMTNKMICTMPRPKADCFFSSGSPVLTVYRDVFFLTGVVSRVPGMECNKGYILQKVSRFLPWINSVLNTA